MEGTAECHQQLLRQGHTPFIGLFHHSCTRAAVSMKWAFLPRLPAHGKAEFVMLAGR